MDPPVKNFTCIKIKLEEPSIILKENIYLNDIKHMEEAIIMGHFSSKQMTMENLKKCIEFKFSIILGCSPYFLILSIG